MEGRAGNVWERESMVGKRCDRGREAGIGSEAGRTGAERGEPCGVFELWASDFMLH